MAAVRLMKNPCTETAVMDSIMVCFALDVHKTGSDNPDVPIYRKCVPVENPFAKLRFHLRENQVYSIGF
jgi:hypothetical protein